MSVTPRTPLVMRLDPKRVETPAFVLDLGAFRHNLAILGDAQRRSGAKILLALKGFAMWSVFPLVREILPGIAASSVAEARLGREEHGGEIHVYAPAYSATDLRELLPIADHLVFNSLGQWQRFRSLVQAAARPIRCGLRVNPEHREVEVALYDPCAPRSRLGVTRRALERGDLSGLSGLHFHNLCEKNVDALERTLAAVEARFGEYLRRVDWVNFGGGHHVTRPDYDLDALARLVQGFRERHGVEVYLEPGEAVALDTGVLVTSVLDVIENDGPIAILDTSASAHMPDVLEMPYRPRILDADLPGVLPHTYRLGGLTCLAGDVIGDYSFAAPLAVGDRLVFADMIHYTMVKTTMFNGVRHPSIVVYDPDTDELRTVRRFGYEDYRTRLS
ncbi:MAG: carboxynorspermidine decarboxylase [Polyangiaceae bacterium]|nr:carboxynorspermidine decarboxylase [Polyangiaceae bacterium]